MSSKKTNNITIVGGSGFVGSSLINKLKPKSLISNIDKNPSPFFNDITTIRNILNEKDLNFDSNSNFLILLAAEHRDDVSPISLYYDVNVRGTQNVLDAMDRAEIKNLIFTSSVAIYGLNKLNPDENHFQDPFNHYGKSKWEAELIIKKWYDNDPKNKSVTILRPTVIFGERNRGNVYNLLKQISSGRFILIGKGKNKKSMAYVGNIVAFIENRLEKNEHGYKVFNYADKPDFNMSELVSIIENKMNLTSPNIYIPLWLGLLGGYIFDFIALLSRKKLSISSVRVRKFCATTQFNSNKANTIFKPPYSLEQGINITLEKEFIQPQKDDIVFYTE